MCATVVFHADRGEWRFAHMVHDHRHGFVCRANASHRRMLRARVAWVMKAARMHPDSLVARNMEADDPMQTIRSVRIRSVVARGGPVLHRIAAVGNMGQCGASVHIVIGHPGADKRGVVIVKMNLVS